MNLKRPKPSEPFLDARGLVTRPWFNYLSALTPDEASAEIGAQITALAQRVSTLEGEGGGLPRSTRAYGQFSVQSNGTLSDGVVVFNLVNDEAAPAPRSYYGTDADGTRYNIIDTAGMRKKKAVEDETLERYSVLRSIAAIDRCDVALLLIDAQTGVTEQDTKIAGLILSAGKAVLVAVNKWDAVEKDTNTMEQFRKKILSDLKFMSYAPVLFLSALTGQRVNTVLAAVKAAYEQYSRRIPTGVLNDVLNDATADLQPPATNGRRLKIYYITQQSACPPTFILFVNEEALMHFAYQRYLENYFRKTFDFTGTPIRFILREKTKEEK